MLDSRPNFVQTSVRWLAGHVWPEHSSIKNRGSCVLLHIHSRYSVFLFQFPRLAMAGRHLLACDGKKTSFDFVLG